jgi:lipopolysaccharide export system protein LptC
LIEQGVKIRTRDHTGQKSYSTPSEASWAFTPDLSFFDRKMSEALGTHHLQATITMATAEKHFHVPSEEEIDKLLTDKDRFNTQKATKLSVKCFRDYLHEHLWMWFLNV